MPSKIEKKGNYLKVSNLATNQQFIGVALTDATYLRDRNDNFVFLNRGQIINAYNFLGINRLGKTQSMDYLEPDPNIQYVYPSTEIVDSAGIAIGAPLSQWATVDDFEDWLATNTAGSSAPISAVESVTGLNTDNTDPLNPIVKISVDGVTVTGQGTPADPLISAGGLFTPTANGVTMKEVTQESDFGIASLGIITLSPNTTYFIRGIVLCTNRLSIVNEGIALKGWNRDDDGLKYTGANGAGDFITITDVNCDISSLKFSSTNSTALDVILRGSNFSYGSYNDGRLKVLTITNCQFRDCYDVLHIEGFDLADFSQTLIWYVKATGMGCHFKNVSKLQISSCEFARWFDEATIPTPSGYATASLVELIANGAGNGFGAINFSGNIFHPQQTQFGIRISDLATIGFGTISSNTGIDVGLTTGAVTEIDYDIQNSIIIQANQKIANGNSYATMALSQNLVLLDNTATNPLVLKAANTVGGGGFTNPITFPISQRTINTIADGSITYNSKINANFVVIVTATVEQAGNGVITMRLRNNGTAITTTVGTTEIRQGIADTLTFSVIGQATLGDVFDVEVESSGGADVLVSQFVLNGYQF